MSNKYGEMYDPNTHEQIKWNPHSIANVQKCLRYYKFKNIEGWERRGTGNRHLVFGSGFANALQAYYHARHAGADRQEAILVAVHGALEETWERHQCPSCHEGMTSDGETCIVRGCLAGRVSRPWDSGDHLKNRFNLIRTIVWYFEDFRDDLPILIIDGKPATEQTFALDIDDGNVLVGTIDRVVDFSGSPYIMDQKTTGSTISRRYFDGFKPDTQMSGYTFAGAAIFNTPLKGVIIDAAQIAVGFTRFSRGLTMRTPSELQEWYDDAMYWIGEGRKAVRENHYPANPASCGNYGGCEFRHICSASPESRMNFMRSDFERTK